MEEFDNALGDQNTRPIKLGDGGLAGLNQLTALLNSAALSGAVVPSQQEQAAAVVNRVTEIPKLAAKKMEELKPLGSNKGSSNKLLFFTGKLKAGKDFVAAAAGAKIFGFADPLYQLASELYGIEVTSTQNKDVPGMREMLQQIGQWGRNEINAKYPLTPARACFVRLVRFVGPSLNSEFLVDWADYGRNKNIWCDAVMRRVGHFHSANPEARVAITNARFQNEFMALKEAGYRHLHIMCSATTWQARLAKSGLTPDSPQVKDLSEAMAASFDADVTKRLSAQRTGSRLAVVWNDPSAPPISTRLHTLDSFLKSLGVAQQEVISLE